MLSLTVRPCLKAPDGDSVENSAALAALLAYNRDDCESTRELADWLWSLRCSSYMGGDGCQAAADATSGQTAALGGGLGFVPAAVSEAEVELSKLQADLKGDVWPVGSLLASEEVRGTLAGLLGYHKREAKPGWWRRFSWLEAAVPDLINELATLGGAVTPTADPYPAPSVHPPNSQHYAFHPALISPTHHCLRNIQFHHPPHPSPPHPFYPSPAQPSIPHPTHPTPAQSSPA